MHLAKIRRGKTSFHLRKSEEEKNLHQGIRGGETSLHLRKSEKPKIRGEKKCTRENLTRGRKNMHLAKIRGGKTSLHLRKSEEEKKLHLGESEEEKL
eukprot:Pgem_evm1s778